MTTRTHALTHSAVFARVAKGQPSDTLIATALQHELLHGVAAQDAFVALFDDCPDFEELAREATQAPIDAEPMAKRNRQASRRVSSADGRTCPGQSRSPRGSADSPSGNDRASGMAGRHR